MATTNRVPLVPALRSMTGVDVTPMVGVTWSQPYEGTSLTLSPAASSDTCHSTEPVSASKAYTESLSVATKTTLWLTPLMLSADRYNGCASTLPSALRKRSWPKLLELTFAEVSTDSVRFWPVRAASFL